MECFSCSILSMDTKPRINVAIPADLHASVKKAADKKGVKLRAFIETIIRSFMKK